MWAARPEHPLQDVLRVHAVPRQLPDGVGTNGEILQHVATYAKMSQTMTNVTNRRSATIPDHEQYVLAVPRMTDQWNRNPRPQLEPQMTSLDNCNINSNQS